MFDFLGKNTIFKYLFIQIFGVFYYLSFFMKRGFLPAPFISDKGDTFMDFFNTMYWAVHEGRYDIWRSVYPPINFIYLQIVRYMTIPIGFHASGFSLRNDGEFAVYFFILTSIVSSIFVTKTHLWNAVSCHNKNLLLIVFLSSTPFLFTVERGNLIVYAIPFIAMLIGDVPVLRVISIAILINIKPYFCLVYFFYISKRQYRELLVSLFVTGSVYIISCVVMGADPLVIPRNLLFFSNMMPFSPGAVLTGMVSSVSAYAFVSGFILEHIHNASSANFVNLFSSSLKYVNYFIMMSSIVVILIRGKVIDKSIVMLVLICVILNMSITVGAYTLIFYFPLLPALIERRRAKIFLIMVAIIFMPLDIVKYTDAKIVQQISYLSGSYVQVQAEVGLGALLRPVLNLAILALLTFEAATTRPAAPERAAAGAEGLNLGVAEQV